MSLDLDNIKRKIHALSKMTMDNGCSEAEALAAAGKMADLLATHGLSFKEIKDFAEGKSKAEFHSYEFGDKKKLHEVQYCVGALAALFDCKVWIDKNSRGDRVIKFFGLEQDVLAAEALTHALVLAMEGDYARWFKGYDNYDKIHGKTLRSNFMSGFTSRVAARLRDMKEAMTVKSTGTSLVVLKNQVVEAGFAELNMKLRKGGKTTVTIKNNFDAWEAGLDAGGRAVLNNNKQLEGNI